MALIIVTLIFMSGLSVGILLTAYRQHSEIEELKSQARDYRSQATALKDLCHRLERVSQLQPLALAGEMKRDFPDHFSSQEFPGSVQV
jgi:hypothetical protein